jgi:site-specific DNA-methyltransferase (adenine-specific)
MLTLYNGDCLEVMRDISSNSVDLIICDLPYGCLSNDGRPKISEEKKKQYGSGRIQSQPGGCTWDVKINLEAFWKEVKRIRKSDHSPCIHFCTTKFGHELICSNEKEFRYDLVWDKQRGVSFLSANKMPMRSHEMIYIFSKAGAFYERVDISGNFKGWDAKEKPRDAANLNCYQPKGKGKYKWVASGNDGTKRCVLSVIPQPGKKGEHPTEKPTDLYRFLIERYCPVGGTVLDPTFGSGNSVFTAFDMDRNAIGIEKDEGFYKKAVARLESL